MTNSLVFNVEKKNWQTWWISNRFKPHNETHRFTCYNPDPRSPLALHVLVNRFSSWIKPGPLLSPNQIRKMKLAGRENKVAVVVGTVTDDIRIQEIPKLKASLFFFSFFFFLPLYLLCSSKFVHFAPQICALRVTDGARCRILKAGGQVMTFDQLALSSPKGHGTVLLSGNWYSLIYYR